MCGAQFLFQDAVRARLGKEARGFQESRSSTAAAPYPMAAAQRLAADFQRLGDAPDGLSYLTHLRKLVTGAPSARIFCCINLPSYIWQDILVCYLDHCSKGVIVLKLHTRSLISSYQLRDN